MGLHVTVLFSHLRLGLLNGFFSFGTNDDDDDDDDGDHNAVPCTQSHIHKADDMLQHTSYSFRPHKAYCKRKKLWEIMSATNLNDFVS
jgi:hypothetical protein